MVHAPLQHQFKTLTLLDEGVKRLKKKKPYSVQLPSMELFLDVLKCHNQKAVAFIEQRHSFAHFFLNGSSSSLTKRSDNRSIHTGFNSHQFKFF